jgi:hypothetical protein
MTDRYHTALTAATAARHADDAPAPSDFERLFALIALVARRGGVLKPDSAMTSTKGCVPISEAPARVVEHRARTSRQLSRGCR